MTKGIVFFDLDNTLLNADTKLDNEVADAMSQLRQNGIVPVISSGRNIFEIQTIMDKAGIDTVVSANGSYVINHGQPIYESKITDEQIERFSKIATEHGNSFVVLNDQTSRLNKFTQMAQNAFDNVNSPVPTVDANFYKTNPIYMMIILTDSEDDFYRQTFENDFTFYRNTPFSMDVVAQGGSKKVGIKKLLELPEYSGVPTYAFGDGNNDIAMLEAVDHPVAMGNALPHVKPYAEFVTTNNTNHGIVNGLKHFKLI
ncbi:hypothetical protein C5L31_000518 [Secundilactobacillus malefermentans]|uniref:Uncharacterized protein n=1 Tax=Secundilactobacillus malefermentans TaxID=176292 RepID=A0A4R5NQ89_9LACO|nr:Cof-type HAD-IIB family hydrolase [Secundilactobacillus malefermentans]KRM57704.1 cof family hydrolase [Secundilactobacillus malefermentans DSM 5705 = KCTC 3548]TDG78858.1 hypothetical protein C5L31_000518 [Secundilactobacillus malefermentans]